MAQHAEKVMSQPSSRQGSSVDLSDKSQSSSDLSQQAPGKGEERERERGGEDMLGQLLINGYINTSLFSNFSLFIFLINDL